MLVITTGVRPAQTLTAAAAEVISTVPHFLRDLSMQGKVPGISHPALATVPHINNLGRYGDAVPPSKDALEMGEEPLGNEHHNVSRSLSENDIIDFQQTPHGSTVTSHSCYSTTPNPGVLVNGLLYFLSKEVFNVQDNIEDYIKTEYGASARLADWSDIEPIFDETEIVIFANSIGFSVQSDDNNECFNGYINLNGTPGPDWRNRYLIARHNGTLPRKWFSISNMGHHYLDLGRWTYPSQALIVIEIEPQRARSIGIPEITVSQTISSSRALPFLAGAERTESFTDINRNTLNTLASPVNK